MEIAKETAREGPLMTASPHGEHAGGCFCKVFRAMMLSMCCSQGLAGMRAGMGPPPPPPLSDDHPAWADEVWASPLDVRRRIFCNRSLNMSQIPRCRL